MTKREAKIEALRICTAILNIGVDYDDDLSADDNDKVFKEIQKIAESIYKRAVRMGGNFDKHTGYPLKEKK